MIDPSIQTLLEELNALVSTPYTIGEHGVLVREHSKLPRWEWTTERKVKPPPTRDQLARLRLARASGKTVAALAREFGLTRYAVRRLLKRRRHPRDILNEQQSAKDITDEG